MRPLVLAHRTVICLTVVLTALALAATATAAMGVQMTIGPAKPRAGHSALIELRPFWPFASGNEPADVNYPFKVEAVSPNGSIYRVRTVRTQNPYVHAGRFTFRRAGRWCVRVTNYGPAYSAYRGHRPRVCVKVRP